MSDNNWDKNVVPESFVNKIFDQFKTSSTELSNSYSDLASEISNLLRTIGDSPKETASQLKEVNKSLSTIENRLSLIEKEQLAINNKYAKIEDHNDKNLEDFSDKISKEVSDHTKNLQVVLENYNKLTNDFKILNDHIYKMYSIVKIVGIVGASIYGAVQVGYYLWSILGKK